MDFVKGKHWDIWISVDISQKLPSNNEKTINKRWWMCLESIWNASEIDERSTRGDSMQISLNFNQNLAAFIRQSFSRLEMKLEGRSMRIHLFSHLSNQSRGIETSIRRQCSLLDVCSCRLESNEKWRLTTFAPFECLRLLGKDGVSCHSRMPKRRETLYDKSFSHCLPTSYTTNVHFINPQLLSALDRHRSLASRDIFRDCFPLKLRLSLLMCFAFIKTPTDFSHSRDNMYRLMSTLCRIRNFDNAIKA